MKNSGTGFRWVYGLIFSLRTGWLISSLAGSLNKTPVTVTVTVTVLSVTKACQPEGFCASYAFYAGGLVIRAFAYRCTLFLKFILLKARCHVHAVRLSIGHSDLHTRLHMRSQQAREASQKHSCISHAGVCCREMRHKMDVLLSVLGVNTRRRDSAI